MTTSHHFKNFNVRFTGKNYSSWEFQFQLFVTGKGLWGHVDGSDSPPTDSRELLQWKVKDAQVMTWILGSVDPLIVLNLWPYKTAKAMWDYLKKVYTQDNTARHFQLDNDIANYSQGSMSIQEYFSGFQNLWPEFTDIIYAKVPAESLSIIQDIHEQSKRDQFLMKLRSEFEAVRSNLMSREPSPSLDICFGELLREEQRLLTQSAFKLANTVTVAFAGQGTRKGRDMSKIKYYSCKEYDHIATHCRKKYECPTRPQNRKANTDSSRHLAASAVSTPATAESVVTQDMVQQMIVSALSALGLQGNDILSKCWVVDYGASNHMTNSSTMLKNVCNDGDGPREGA
ncbi:hypothetical protein K2173_018993 [Erythroxylum novogranatense]|uniref:Retrotransposon Copia-like N-terminal domain-containing protein n=1 Tax=Erythroxylum novogranatense TaxID=1862640 RepID=A0AAV8ST25_9ROSI|nr:hypothetical protein K2173_018993 [Erythroxylum novogranatense]